MKKISIYIIFLSLFITSISCEKDEELFIEAPTSLVSEKIDNNSFKASWNNVPNANHYLFEIATDKDFEYLVKGYRDFKVAAKEIVVTDLTPLKQYYFRVKTVGNGTSSNFSSTKEYYTIVHGTATMPAKAVNSNSFIANWTSENPVAAYTLDVAEDMEFKTILPNYNKITVKDVELKITGLTQGTNYYYRVTKKNDPIYSNTTKVFTKITPCKITAVKDITSNSAVIEWTKNERSDKYIIEVSTEDNFENLLYTIEEENNTSIQLENLEGNWKNFYFARIKAMIGEKSSLYSNVARIQVSDQPEIGFEITAPETNPYGATIMYEHSEDRKLTAISISIATDKEISIVVDSKYLSQFSGIQIGDKLTFKSKKLKPNKTYYARAEMSYFDSNSKFKRLLSKTVAFTTPAITKTITKISNNEFKAAITYNNGTVEQVAITKNNVTNTYKFTYNARGVFKGAENINNTSDSYAIRYNELKPLSTTGNIPYILEFNNYSKSSIKYKNVYFTKEYSADYSFESTKVTSGTFKSNGTTEYQKTYTYNEEIVSPFFSVFQPDILKYIYFLGTNITNESFPNYHKTPYDLTFYSLNSEFLPTNESVKDASGTLLNNYTFEYIKNSEGDVTEIIQKEGNTIIDTTKIEY